MARRKLFTLLAIILVLLVAGLAYILRPPVITAEWNKSPENLVLSIHYFGEIDANYIPPVQVWGDGCIVWVEFDPSGQRYVWEGQLSQAELAQLISRLIGAGFFKDYEWFSRSDATYFGEHLELHLLSASHSIFIEKADKTLQDLAELFRHGTGATRTEFIPQEGKLRVYTLEDLRLPLDTTPNHQWPDKELGYTLEDVYARKRSKRIDSTNGGLLVAWEIVNSPNPFVESNGKVFWVAFRPSFPR